jgi:hypothetical protein
MAAARAHAGSRGVAEFSEFSLRVGGVESVSLPGPDCARGYLLGLRGEPAGRVLEAVSCHLLTGPFVLTHATRSMHVLLYYLHSIRGCK